jgi:hypothetical protein
MYIFVLFVQWLCRYTFFDVTIMSRYRKGGYSHVNIYIYGGWLSTFEHKYIYLPSIIPDTWPSLFPPRGGGDN